MHDSKLSEDKAEKMVIKAVSRLFADCDFSGMAPVNVTFLADTILVSYS